MSDPVSFVKAAQDYFSKAPHGRKVEISEFKALTDTDKSDLRTMLEGEGYTLEPAKVK